MSFSTSSKLLLGTAGAIALSILLYSRRKSQPCKSDDRTDFDTFDLSLEQFITHVAFVSLDVLATNMMPSNGDLAGTIVLFDLESRKELSRIQPTGVDGSSLRVYSIAGAKSRFIAAATEREGVLIWDAADPRNPIRLENVPPDNLRETAVKVTFPPTAQRWPLAIAVGV